MTTALRSLRTASARQAPPTLEAMSSWQATSGSSTSSKSNDSWQPFKARPSFSKSSWLRIQRRISLMWSKHLVFAQKVHHVTLSSGLRFRMFW